MTRAAIFLFASCAFAQFGASTGASAGTPASQLPLSGRTGQTGSVLAAQSTVPGATGSINTINPSIQVSGAFAGSAGSATGLPSSKKLSLHEAVQRGLQYNPGAVGMANAVRQAHGRQRVARSSLLPNLNGYFRDSVQQLNLKAQGLGRIAIPFSGFSFPTCGRPVRLLRPARVWRTRLPVVIGSR